MLGKLFLGALAFASCIAPAAAQASGCADGQVGIGFRYLPTVSDGPPTQVRGYIVATNCGIIDQDPGSISIEQFYGQSVCGEHFGGGARINCDGFNVNDVTLGNGQVFSKCTNLTPQGQCNINGDIGVPVCCSPA